MSQEHQDWLEERKKYVTASDVAAILGLNPYKKPIEVYQEKIGVTLPFRGNEHTERGKRMEPLILIELSKAWDGTVRILSNKKLHTSLDFPFLAATYDAIGIDSDGVSFPIEVKCPSKSWNTIPDYYKPQLWAQMVVMKSRCGYFVWACDKVPFDLHELYVSIDYFTQSNQWLNKLERFYKCMQTGTLSPEFW